LTIVIKGAIGLGERLGERLGEMGSERAQMGDDGWWLVDREIERIL
jgi:hypothetical protein